jgi:large exoprotein involved in heme utilization and adhesion
MNKAYRIIWNESTHAWSVVSEIAKSCGKRASGAVILAAAGILFAPAMSAYAAPPNPPAATALPTGGQTVAGSAGISQSGSTMTITQDSNRASINWNTFNVGSSATVNFVQPLCCQRNAQPRLRP